MSKFQYIVIAVLVCGLGVVVFWTYGPDTIEEAYECIMRSEGGIVYFEKDPVVLVNVCREPEYLRLSKSSKKAFFEHWRSEGWEFKCLPTDQLTGKAWFVHHPIAKPWIVGDLVKDEETAKRARILLDRYEWLEFRKVALTFCIASLLYLLIDAGFQIYRTKKDLVQGNSR